MKNIKINFDVLEMMVFFWESVASKDKISDDYFVSVAEKPQMEVVYGEGFSKDSVRRVLSAISNRERLNDRTQQESRFWNNNMWILEDLQTMHNMMAPIKTLNLKEFIEKYKDNKYEEIEIIFIPAHTEEYYIKDNKLYINFFKLIPNCDNPTDIKIAGMELKEYIDKKIAEAV
ncbi:hypothetical protein [Treponema pedis]|uniref:TDE2712 family protein n=1 Tax=Treponema pedis TaxID=409322 RepID=UPI000408B830|nr:hypothetical protein [Treponema pedis]QSI04353.1 hypothetical protein DYQ05_05080 [Treponema pedis]